MNKLHHIGNIIDQFFDRWPKAKPWLWLIVLWVVGFTLLAIVAYGIKGLMPRPPVFE